MKWYAIKYTDGAINVRRFFSPDRMENMRVAPRVHEVTGPFEASSRAGALAVASERFKPPYRRYLR